MFVGATDNGQVQNKQIRASVADISYFMCFGEKSKARNDEEFQQLMDSLKNIMAFAKQASMADSFPWALHLPFVKRKYNL